MASKSIEEFVEKLARVPSTDVSLNPYNCKDRGEACKANLLNYLQHLQSHGLEVMLIGEAPGRKGCAKTGIPFTDPRELRNPVNEFILGSWEKDLPPKVSPENQEVTASRVWSVLRESEVVPLLWNIYPFNPLLKGNPNKIRKPCAAELAQGLLFVEELIEMFDVDRDRVFAVGRKAQKKLGLDDDHYLTHPSPANRFHKLFPEQFKMKTALR